MSQKMVIDYEVKKDFPIFENQKGEGPFIYLDSAATSLTPKAVIDGISAYYAQTGATVHRGTYSLCLKASSQYQEVRKQVAVFINAPMEDEVIFTSGTTDSLNKVARMLEGGYLQQGDEILIVETEHHANIVPWQMVASRVGATVHAIPVDDEGCVDLEVYEKMLSSKKAKVVAVAHIANFTGVEHPVKKMAKLASDAGAITVCDGAQAVAHKKVDVMDLGVDFYAFSAHKMYGPKGVGVLWGRLNLLESLDPIVGGGDMIETVGFDQTTYAVPPLKFEAGTPNVAGVIGLGKAVEYVSSFEHSGLIAWQQALIKELKDGLVRIEGTKIYGKEQSSLVSFSIAGLHPLDIGMMLNLKGISIRTGHLCAMPALQRLGAEHVLRASIGIYNTMEDIKVFLKELVEVMRRMQVRAVL